MKKLTVLLVAVSWLAGCGARVSEPRLEIYCPSPKEYDTTFNTELADASEDAENVIIEALSDYAELRDKLHNCQEIRKR